MMRRLETGIRKEKGEKVTALSIGDTEQANKNNRRIKAYKAKYNEICDITGLSPETRRMSITATQKSIKYPLQNSGNGGIISILPEYKNAEIGLQKFTEYALNPLKDENKAKAFESALGYTADNATELISNIRENIKNFSATEKNDNGYGKRYEIIMTLTGRNGKKANVKTAWIIDKNTKVPRLTSAYVTKKKFKE